MTARTQMIAALLADVAMEHARVQLGPDWYACTRCAGDRTARGHAEHVADIQAERLAALDGDRTVEWGIHWTSGEIVAGVTEKEAREHTNPANPCWAVTREVFVGEWEVAP